jgi:hypothetical protein
MSGERPQLYKLLQTLIENCEIALDMDATGWHFSARGGLGVITLVIFFFYLFRRRGKQAGRLPAIIPEEGGPGVAANRGRQGAGRVPSRMIGINLATLRARNGPNNPSNRSATSKPPPPHRPRKKRGFQRYS